MSNKKFHIFLIITVMFFTVFTSSCKIKSDYQTTKKENPLFFAINATNTSQDVFIKAWSALKSSYLDKTLNQQDWYRWKKRYLNEIKTKEDAYLAIETMIESLDDPYTRFLTPYDFAEQDRNIDAELHGIGVHIVKFKENITIVQVIDDSPAKSSGLKPGDIILKINNESTKGMNLKEVADKVRGKEGTKVTLRILRDKKYLIKEIIRKKINIKSVEYKILEDTYAYIKISSFISSETAFEMIKALNDTKNTKGLIIDLRGNQGGLLPNAIFIANMFIDKGIIVSMVDRNNHKKSIKAESGIAITKKPIVVLINHSSASASEILSGALKDHNRAVLVGEKTYGKAFVQKIHKLPDGSGINITIAKYLTPNGNDIDKKGIQPDYTVKITEKDFMQDKDPQLEKAKQTLKAELKKDKYTAVK